MTISPQTLEQIELDLETAHGNFVGGFVDPAVTADTKMLAAAIALAGSEIALAITATRDGRSERSS
jgi:hypothetical protein